MAGPLRLLAVAGYLSRQNDVIYNECKTHMNAASKVVFFGGDVQDYLENMTAHRDNHRHSRWNLEATATILAEAFPQSNILVVKPSRMCLQTFSCYDNFVESSRIGVPSYSENYHALLHLSELIGNVGRIIEERTSTKDSFAGESNKSKTSENSSDDCSIVLIGFSKGCVVLNQLVYEIHENVFEKNLRKFISNIEDIYWLDGGHAGGSNVWLTDSQKLKSLAETGIRLHVHVTPYQIEDDQRPWIRKEERIFTEKLKKLKAPLMRKKHFVGETPSIEMHFRLLEEFYK